VKNIFYQLAKRLFIKTTFPVRRSVKFIHPMFGEASRFVMLKEKLLLFIFYFNMQGKALLLAST
jgi:hypothetical protein